MQGGAGIVIGDCALPLGMGFEENCGSMDARVDVDPRRVKVHRTPAVRDVPYVPTDDAVVPAILRLAEVGAGDVVFRDYEKGRKPTG